MSHEEADARTAHNWNYNRANELEHRLLTDDYCDWMFCYRSSNYFG